MPELTHDIIIHGAGPTGSCLALALAGKVRHPERIALTGAFPEPGAGTPTLPHPDPRTLALNHGSRAFLEQFGAWPTTSADITTVHVSQQHRLGRTLICHQDMGVPRLGSVVAYQALINTLHEHLRHSGITLISDTQGQTRLVDGHVSHTLPNRRLTARLAVQSHGGQPIGLHRTYDQQAVLATAMASLPQAGWAYERFTRQGPLALLPHPANSSAYAVVWCCPPAQADQLLELPSSEFDQALNRHFGDRLGQLRSVGPRHRFPLALHAGPILLNPLTVAIGNAAQTLHPVAGQGLNLGLRDVAQLAITLSPWLAHPETDVRPSLQHYLNSRRADRWLTAGITDLLPRLFITANPVVEHACGLALMGLDIFPPARHLLARHLLQGHRV